MTLPKQVDVLILSSLADLSTDRICHHLSTAGVSFLRLNRDQLSEVRIQIDPLNAQMICIYADYVWHIGDNLRSIWWRQPTFLRNLPSRIISIEEQLERSQWSATIRGLMLFDNVRWYNDPAATYRAESKPYQLRQAKKIGFDVPETILTNDIDADVPKKIGRKFALKSVDTVLLSEGDSQHFGYTNVVDWADCIGKGFQTLPSMCQKLLSPKLDLRVTIIGDRLWCSTVETDHGGIEGDWRLTRKSDLKYNDFALPMEEKNRCFELLDKLGLRYGAIDLAFSDNKYWFIEINPTGEWGWLDSNNREISKTIALELANESGGK